jgi:hypothetical protein
MSRLTRFCFEELQVFISCLEKMRGLFSGDIIIIMKMEVNCRAMCGNGHKIT